MMFAQMLFPKNCWMPKMPSESVFSFPTHPFLFLEVGHGMKPAESEPESFPTPV